MLAANMAAELAAEGKSVLLVDADSYGASVAAMLGLLDEAAGLAQACRLADQGLLDAEALLRIAAPVVTRTGTFRVLTGITRADRWTELRAAALSLVLARARQVVDVTVIDTGFCLESDEELSFDTMAPRRNAATLRSLELADTVFAVGAADSIGVPRLVRGLAELESAVPQASPRVVLNKVRPVRGGPFPGAATARRLGAVRPRRPAVSVPPGRSGLEPMRRCSRDRSCWRPRRIPRSGRASPHWFVHPSSEIADPLYFLPQRSVG